MENTEKGIEMKNNETIIEEVTDEKKRFEDYSLGVKLTGIAVGGAMKTLAQKQTYAVGLGVGLLFGKKTGLKAMVAMVGANVVYNTARYLTGDIKIGD